MNGRMILGLAAIACFVAAAIGVEVAVNLFYLGWAFVIAAWLVNG